MKRCSNEVFKSVYTHASVTHGWKASLNNCIYDQIVHPWTNRSPMIKLFNSDQTVHSWPGAKRPGPKCQGAKRPGPKCQGAKCPGPKRQERNVQVQNVQGRNFLVRNVMFRNVREWNVQVQKVRGRNVLVQNVRGWSVQVQNIKTSRSKMSGEKRPRPKRQGIETSRSKMSGGESCWSKMSGAKRPCPNVRVRNVQVQNINGAKRPGPKRQWGETSQSKMWGGEGFNWFRWYHTRCDNRHRILSRWFQLDYWFFELANQTQLYINFEYQKINNHCFSSKSIFFFLTFWKHYYKINQLWNNPK